MLRSACCILFDFYIKPQRPQRPPPRSSSCILFDFYIKPQLVFVTPVFRQCCILFDFYIKPQHVGVLRVLEMVVSYSISTSNHNGGWCGSLPRPVVSYSISTSNHNLDYNTSNKNQLYLIRFLHQTTTCGCRFSNIARCILFDFYIKPQLVWYIHYLWFCCILFDFYIKPQHTQNTELLRVCCILFDFYIKPQQRKKVPRGK